MTTLEKRLLKLKDVNGLKKAGPPFTKEGQPF